MQTTHASKQVRPPPLPDELAFGVTVEVWIDVPQDAGGGLQALLSQWRQTLPEPHLQQLGTFILSSSDLGGGPAFRVNTQDGILEVFSSEPLQPGTRHLAGTFDGNSLQLFVDAKPIARLDRAGLMTRSDLPVVVADTEDGAWPFTGRVLHAAIFPGALTPTEIASKHLWHRIAEEADRRPEIELDAHYVLDRREILRGSASFPEPSPKRIELSMSRREGGEVVWRSTLTSAVKAGKTVFQIPLGGIRGGYYVIEARDELDRAAQANLAIREENSAGGGNSGRRDYLGVARAGVERILAAQTLRLRGDPDGTEFVTTDLPSGISYLSLGHRKGNSFATGWAPATGFEYETTRADHEIWPILDALSEASGDPRFRALTKGMVDALAGPGFDERCGLLYFGQECDFDALGATVRPILSPRQVPTFKPIDGRLRPGMHLERFWSRLPAQTHRWLRATFYGHVTDPDSMDFNRVAFYCFDDRDRAPTQRRDNVHCGFASCASSLILFWSSCWVYAGDAECLGWAQRMTDKWAAVQDPHSGLFPYFFGAGAPQPGPQIPGPWAETRGSALASELMLRAASLLGTRDGAEGLAEQLRKMGTRSAIATAAYGYDASRHRFREHLNLDGTPLVETARYCFRTQEEKDEAVRADPAMADVAVYDGAGFYRMPNYYENFAGSNIPYNLSGAAMLCRDPELVDLLRPIAADAVEEAGKIRGAFTPENRWTFRATGWYVELCLRLFELTGDRLHLEQARGLADREIEALEGVRYPEWWRLRERTIWLEALLHLHRCNL